MEPKRLMPSNMDFFYFLNLRALCFRIGFIQNYLEAFLALDGDLVLPMADTKLCLVVKKKMTHMVIEEWKWPWMKNLSTWPQILTSASLNIMKSHQVSQKCEKKTPDEIALRLYLTLFLSTTTKTKEIPQSSTAL